MGVFRVRFLSVSFALVRAMSAPTSATEARHRLDPHIAHSEMERIHPSKLRALPHLLLKSPEFRNKLHSSLGLPLLHVPTASSSSMAVPTVAVDRTVIKNCMGGRVLVNISSGPDFHRNNSDWIGLYSPAVT
jgi:hypothetical protein